MFDSQQMKDKKKVQETDCNRRKTDMNTHRQTEIDRDPQKLPSTTSYYEARTKYFKIEILQQLVLGSIVCKLCRAL